jgi:hypothetical protein
MFAVIAKEVPAMSRNYAFIVGQFVMNVLISHALKGLRKKASPKSRLLGGQLWVYLIPYKSVQILNCNCYYATIKVSDLP